MIEHNLTLKQLKEYLDKENISYKKINVGPKNIHIFTHKKWQMNSFFIELTTKENLSNYTWITELDIENTYAIPSAYQPFKQAIIERMKNKK